MAAKKTASKKKTEVVEQTEPTVTLVDTLFKTDTITMDPGAIYGIVSKGSQISIYTHMSPTPIQVPAEKDDNGKPIELEIYTLRLAAARENKERFNQIRWALEMEAVSAAEPAKENTEG